MESDITDKGLGIGGEAAEINPCHPCNPWLKKGRNPWRKKKRRGDLRRHAF